jgi:hypothetical protein
MDNPTKLIVKIDYFIEPDARETGRILDRLGLAYSQSLKADEQPAQRFVLMSVEISSWVASLGAVFESGAAITKLIENRDWLSNFVRDLVINLEILRQSNAGQIPAAIRNLLIELATPLNRKRASEVHIYVHGDNANVFLLGQEDARVITRAWPKTGGSSGMSRSHPLPPSELENLDDALSALSGTRANDQAVIGQTLRSVPIARNLNAGTINRANSGPSTSQTTPPLAQAKVRHDRKRWVALIAGQTKFIPVTEGFAAPDRTRTYDAAGRVEFRGDSEPHFHVVTYEP